MARPSLEAVRRKELVNSAISEISRIGSLDVTVSQIAKNAGVSSALAHHYFGSKDQIFLAAMRHIMSQFGVDVRAGLQNAITPRQRVEAIITAGLSVDNFRKDVISAWLNFYVKAQNSTDVQRLLRVYQRRLQSNLCHELRPLAGQSAPDIARGLGAMIDGIYIRQALRDSPPDPVRATALVIDYLDISLMTKAPH